MPIAAARTPRVMSMFPSGLGPVYARSPVRRPMDRGSLAPRRSPVDRERRPPQQIPLPELDPQFHERAALRLDFDALGDEGRADAAADRREAGDDLALDRVLVDAPH